MPEAKRDFMLVCKSYRGDAARVKRLLGTLARHNPQAIPIFIIVPKGDVPVFREVLAGERYELVTDEDVVRSHPQAASANLLDRLNRTPGYRSQQVIKADAWRLLGCASYLSVDSDTVFLRDIARANFLHPAGHPYTLMHQSRDLLQLAIDRGHSKVAQHFREESERMKSLFERVGPDYDFGPQPLIWSARVWSDLHDRFFAPRGWTLWDAIDHIPTEIRWYGEAVLAYRSIPVEPIEPLFRVYHHDWQWLVMRRLGETPEKLAEQFLGACYQSNWEYELDALDSRSALSRFARRIKRWRRRMEAMR
ncbi:MAG: hypothetical protein JF606_09735 [Burkholderiales bacterium]|jgi:hypothetical protein|nr:hypothetical protein [Burkholderiales bacterium]